MANFIESDKKKINCAYKTILLNLKDYLNYYDIKDAITCSKIIFNMLHGGSFSRNGIVYFDNNYDYLGLPLDVSQGVQVMYEVCCCSMLQNFFIIY